jgi:hypothetical protein
MSYLFDYGEGLFCFVPVFTVDGVHLRGSDLEQPAIADYKEEDKG